MQRDHSREPATAEFRVVGPPGCGKTTWLGSQVEQAVEAGEKVMISSLAKAAATEIAGRRLPIPFDSLGTLHSHCFHALGSPEIVEGREHIEQWNEDEDEYHLSLGAGDVGEKIDGDNLEPTQTTLGDELMSIYQIFRARMSADRMPAQVSAFAQRWTEWKEANGLMDFTDLIETCLRDVTMAPGMPDVMFVDEAQDLDLLEMSLIRKWGEAARRLYIVGDPDQAIFTWRGADPGAFTSTDLPEENRQVLSQSYRVPVAVHAQAIRWISQMEGREQIEYLPRDHDGAVPKIPAGWENPEQAVADAEQYLWQGMSVMFLTTCSYMLTPLIRTLRQAGIPFHNLFRRRNGAWNPLQRRRGQTSTSDRILAFLRMSERGMWKAEDINRWADMLKVKGALNANGRKSVQTLMDTQEFLDDNHVSWDDLHRVLTNEAIEAGLTGDLDWFEEQMTAARKSSARFPLTIARKRGAEELARRPNACVGTVHSVKGAEADVVYVFPDVSRAGMREWTGNAEQMASVYRLFYVAMTRAKDTLALCYPSGEFAVDLGY